jgi:hypothetical protein
MRISVNNIVLYSNLLLVHLVRGTKSGSISLLNPCADVQSLPFSHSYGVRVSFALSNSQTGVRVCGKTLQFYSHMIQTKNDVSGTCHRSDLQNQCKSSLTSTAIDRYLACFS